jgi:hypothetical protein
MLVSARFSSQLIKACFHYIHFPQTGKTDTIRKRCKVMMNITEYGGISRNMANYQGISRHFPGIHRNITIFSDGIAMRLFINMDVWQHILLQKWWIFPILTVSIRQQLYSGNFICSLYHYYECSPKSLNQYMINSSWVTASWKIKVLTLALFSNAFRTVLYTKFTS